MLWCWIENNIIELLSCLVTILGLIYGLYQWKRSVIVKRADFVFKIYEKLRLDKDIMNAVYMIDYDKTWYQPDFHKKHKVKCLSEQNKELYMDKFFSVLSYICYLQENGCIDEKEFQLFKYDIDRVCKSYQCQNYLWNIYHFSNDELHTKCPYDEIINYAITNGMIAPKIFFSQEECFYKNYVDFIGQNERRLS